MSDPIKVGSVEEVKELAAKVCDRLAKVARDELSTLSAGSHLRMQASMEHAVANTLAERIRSLNIVWEPQESCLLCGWPREEKKDGTVEHDRAIIHQSSGVYVCIECRDRAQTVTRFGLTVEELGRAATAFKAQQEVTTGADNVYVPAPPTVEGEDVCSCGEKDAEVCRQNPSIAPSYCRVRAAKEEVKRG